MPRRVHTGCRDCGWCTSSRMGRNNKRNMQMCASIFTLGIAGARRKMCLGCNHPMKAHAEPALIASPIPAPGSSSQPPAGWFVDTSNPGYLRWWDGQRWTEHTKAAG